MHKGVEHVGKLPERAARQMQLTDKMRALNDHLEKAVAEEITRLPRPCAIKSSNSNTRWQADDEILTGHVERR